MQCGTQRQGCLQGDERSNKGRSQRTSEWVNEWNNQPCTRPTNESNGERTTFVTGTRPITTSSLISWRSRRPGFLFIAKAKSASRCYHFFLVSWPCTLALRCEGGAPCSGESAVPSQGFPWSFRNFNYVSFFFFLHNRCAMYTGRTKEKKRSSSSLAVDRDGITKGSLKLKSKVEMVGRLWGPERRVRSRLCCRNGVCCTFVIRSWWCLDSFLTDVHNKDCIYRSEICRRSWMEYWSGVSFRGSSRALRGFL